MIGLNKNYKIEFVNGEEMLFVYLECNSRFVKLGSKNCNNILRNVVKRFIFENNICFNGETIVFIVDGVMIGTLLLNDNDLCSKYRSILCNTLSKMVFIIDNVNNGVDFV